MPRRWPVDGRICHVFNRAAAKVQILTRRHAVAYLAAHPERSGAVYQGRYRCVPVQDGEHLLTLLLYVDRNPLKARLVPRAEHWLWSSTLHHAGLENDDLLDPLPSGFCGDWLARVNRLEASDDLAEEALKRNLPLGEGEWVAQLSREWNELRRPRGRPGKINREEFQA